MEKFWTDQEWLDKVKEQDFELYEKILDGKNIKMEWESCTLIIDDSQIPLKLESIKK